jgi:protein-arginine kinase activator protein McsA
LRYKAPIFIYDSILKKAGFTTAVSSREKKVSKDKWIAGFDTEQNEKKKEIKDLKKLSISKLKNMLITSVANEDYEKAARLRDELSNRKR